MPATTESLALNEGLESGMKIQVSRTIRAKRERVFAAWTRPEIIQQWFGPKALVTSAVHVDLRVGGAYSIEMTNPAQPEAAATVGVSGVYQQIVPNELISFTWNGAWFPNEETLVTVTLADTTGGTEVVITHEHFKTIESMKAHEQGWIGGMANFVRITEA
jgi:uncharacterized protein YndB with AHSA1/START domain